MWNDFATKKTVTCRNLLLIMSSLRNEALLETLFEEVCEELVTPNFKQLEPQDVTILEEYVGTIAQQRFEDCSR